MLLRLSKKTKTFCEPDSTTAYYTVIHRKFPRSTSPAAMYISVPASSVPTEKTMTISSIPYGTDNRFSKPLAKNITTTIIESGRINPMLSGKETPISRSSHWIKICMGTFVPRAWISEPINTYHKKFPKNRECT